MKRLMKLKFVNPNLQRVVAVVSASNADEKLLREYVEAPPDKSDSELVGTFIHTGGTPVPQKKTLFVIPTYHANEKLERCLKTLREQHDGKMEYEIVIVNDGGPSIDSAILLAAQYEAKLVSLEKNSGFSAAVNAGIREGDDNAENIILVNDDLWFDMPAGAFISETLEGKSDVALVGTLLLYPSGKVQHAGKESASGHILHGQGQTPRAFSNMDILGVTGALLGINKRFLEQAVCLDESYHMGWEDADLCLTAYTLGWKVHYLGQAYAYHDEGGTRGRTPEEKKEYKSWNSWEDKGRKTFEAKWGKDYAEKNWVEKPTRTCLDRLILKRTTALGDVLFTTPIVHALRKKNPDSEIVVATQHPFIYRDNPDVDYVIPINHKWVSSKDCELFCDLDLSYEKTPSKSMLKAYADVCGLRIRDPWPRVYLREQNRLFAKITLGDSRRWAVIHPGPRGWPGSDWPHGKFSNVSSKLRKMGFSVVLLGNTTPSDIECDMDLRHKTSFHDLAAIIEKADLFVGLDSMPLHLAQAFKIPCVGIFGCVDPELRLIDSTFIKGVTASKKQVPCLGCHHRHTPPQTHSFCDRDREYCMELLGVDSVMEAVESVLR